MKTPQRIVWTEGMFMAPQHLQQNDRYHEYLLSARISALLPYDWGVLDAVIDPRLLAAGQLKFQRFTAVLPDGLPIFFDDSHPETPSAKAIEGHFPPTQRVLEVFIGVPSERDGAANYMAPGGNAGSARFTIVNRNVYDMTGGSAEHQVPFAQRNVAVLFGDEPREGYEVIKVAEIVRDQGGAYIVRDGFVPSCRRINASPWIMANMRRILSLASTKQRMLSETRRQRDNSTVEFGPGDVTRFLLLNSLNTFIPVMSHLIDQAVASPEETFLLLSQFAGMLSSFAVDSDPNTLPKYTYADLGGCYDALFQRITMLLQATVKEGYLTVKLESRPDGLHFGRFEDDKLMRAQTWVLTVTADGIADQDVMAQLPRISKVASWEDITQIVQAATPGVPLQVTYRPPAEIPVKSGTVYFTLNIADRYWRNILAERAIAIYLPPPFEPSRIKLELLAIPPAG